MAQNQNDIIIGNDFNSGEFIRNLQTNTTLQNQIVTGSLSTANGAAAVAAAGKLPLRSALAEIVARYNAARRNNARVNAVIPITADGVAPTAGQLGWTTSTAGTIANYTAYTLNATITNTAPETTGSIAPFKLLGGMPGKNGGSGFMAYCSALKDGSMNRASPRIVFEIDTNFVITVLAGKEIVLTINDGSGPRRVQKITAAGSGTLDVALNFTQLGGNKRRTIELWQSGQDSSVIVGFKIPNNATLSTASVSRPQIVILTDSLGNTVPNGYSYDSFTSTMADYLDCEVWCIPEGSTGYTTYGDSVHKRLMIEKVDMLATMPNFINPAVIALAAGVNDTDTAAFQGIVEAAIQRACDLFPNTLVAVYGCWAANNISAQTTKATQELKIAAACAKFPASRVQHVATMNAVPPYIKGSGNTSSVQNDGNGDFIWDTGDGTHWNTYGHSVVVGPRAADDLVAAVRRALAAGA